jgi:hypothetical protein
MILTIHKWSDTFENADTRKRERLKFFHSPSGCDSTGYVELVTCHGSAGLLALGVFQALCQLAATMKKDARGKFVRSNGSAMPLRQIALLIRVEICHLEQAVEILTAEGIGWLKWEAEKSESATEPATICHPNGTQSADDMPRNSGFVQGQGQGKGEVGERDFAREAERIVSHYPRQERRNEALQVVVSHLREGDDPKAMLAGTKACAAVIRSLPSGSSNRFAPSALKFFEGKRWADDPETLRRQDDKPGGTATNGHRQRGGYNEEIKID